MWNTKGTVIFVGEHYEQPQLENKEVMDAVIKLRELQNHYFVHEGYKVYYKFGRRSCILVHEATDILDFIASAMKAPRVILCWRNKDVSKKA